MSQKGKIENTWISATPKSIQNHNIQVPDEYMMVINKSPSYYRRKVEERRKQLERSIDNLQTH